ncbi:hypothetical protein L208DRAFT_1406892 [Tricholoma matsutake]|nr:hypothetical protein L208DRAFT_1406892 [Tricholoma matsutake 945]
MSSDHRLPITLLINTLLSLLPPFLGSNLPERVPYHAARCSDVIKSDRISKCGNQSITRRPTALVPASSFQI